MTSIEAANRRISRDHWPLWRGSLVDLAIAGAGFAAAWTVYRLLEPWLIGGGQFLPFILPLLGSALFVGRRPTLLITVLAILYGLFEVRSDGSLSAPELVQLGFFALGCAGILILSERTSDMREWESRRMKQAEEASRVIEGAWDEVRRRERHLQSIMDTVPEAMIVIDELGKVHSFSATAQAMFGFSEEEIVGENVSALMPSPDRERHDGYLRRYLQTGERRIIGSGRVTTARRRNGTTFPIHLHVGEARVGNRRLFTGFIEDLTERQETELKLHNLQSELAHVSRISAMGTLATSLAHELNQPLTAIANYTSTACQLLANSDEETVPMLREALAECSVQSLRAGQIVHRLRDFIARGESEKRVESLGRLVSEASALALVGTGNLGIDLEVDIPADCDGVVVDRIQMQQVFLNLIRNAIEAMRISPERRLRISARLGDNEFAEVIVEDSGPGLPEEVRTMLFRPFISTKAEGMGVGLSICHTIMGGHRGRIWAEESEFGGTAFHLTLLLARTDDD